MPAARSFQLALDVAQPRSLTLQFGTCFFGGLRKFNALGFGFLFLYQPEQVLRGVALGFECAVLFCHLGLCP